MKLVKILRIAALSCVSLIGMSQAASAEPISIAIVTALGIAGGTTLFATAVAVTNFALGLAVNFGLSLLSGALAKKPKQQGGSQTQVQYSADSYRIVPFGTVAIAGREVYWKGVGKKNKTNCYVIQLADWQCHQLRAVWVNGVRKTLTPVTVVGTEAARYEVQSFGSKFIVKWFPGTTTQTADSELITMSADTAGGSIGGWTADHIGKGVCYVSFIIEYDEELMPARPQLLWEIDGALLYDWRKDTTNGGSGAHRWDDPTTWEFSSNPAVCDYNWCRGFWRNGMLLAGIGAASYDLLHSAYTTAANICDETLDDGGGSRKRYVVSVIINADGEHRIAREAFIAAMAGDGVERGGQFAVLAGAAYSPVMTLTDDDMASAHSFKFQQKSPLSEIYNAVHVSWLNLDQPWSAHTLTPLTDSQYEDQDGGQRIARDIDLAMVPNPYQARAIGKVVLEQSRMQAIHTGVYGGKTAVLEPGDWVTRQFNRDTGFGVSSFLDTDPYGFDASALTDSYLNRMGTDELTMKVVSKRRAGPELYELTLRQCAAANFTAPAGPITVAGQPVVTPPVYTPATPGTPALVETVSINADGAAVSTITATWTASADAASYVISIKEGSADWVDRRLGNVLIYSFRGRTGVTYQARVRAIDNSDLLSLWSGTASILVTGDTTAPSAPSGLSAAGVFGRIMLSWTNPGDGDLAGTEIWEAATGDFASATLIHTTAAPDQMWVRDNLGNAITRYYWIKARDRTGNVSARYPAGSGVSATTLMISAVDLATGLAGIEIMAALPATGNYQGRQVFLTTDNKLYRHTGSPSNASGFTLAVDGADLVARTITASKLLIADFTNSVINSDFGGNTADGYYQANGSATIIAVTPRGGASEPLMSAPTDYVAAVGSGAQATQCGVFKMPCKGGEEYYVEVMVAGASGSTKTAYLAAHWYALASGSSTQIDITGTGFVPGTSWSTLSGTLTIPAGATAVSIGVRHDNAAGPIYFTKLRVIRRASADLVVDGAITAVKMNVTSLSAIQANMGTLTAGKILGSNGFEIDATNERITSSNFVDGKAGFRLDGVSGSVKAYSGEFAGGTSSKLPFEAKFGLIQDGVLSDEGLASVRLPASLTGSADISLSGTAKRTPTGFEYDITAERVSSSAKSYIQGSFSRAKGITCPPAVCYTDTDAATVYFAYINSLGEIYTARMAHGTFGYNVAPTNVTLVGNLINSIDSDPMFEGVYADTVVHIWKSVLIKGIRRIRVPATVTVSGVPTAVVKMRVWMWGAAGQANKAVRGGPGGYVKFDHTVDPGEILSLLVGGYDGDGFGGCSSVAGVTSAPDVLDGQGGGGSFLWRGPTLRANLLGVAGGGGGGPGDARNTGLKIGGPGGSTAFGGGNGVSGSAMDVCMGKSTQSGAPKGSGGGGYVGGGNFTGIGYPGKGGTNYVIGTATSVTNSASAEDGSGYSTTTTPPGTGESVYTANQSYTWGRANVGVATNTQAKAGPGMIAIQWLTS